MEQGGKKERESRVGMVWRCVKKGESAVGIASILLLKLSCIGEAVCITALMSRKLRKNIFEFQIFFFCCSVKSSEGTRLSALIIYGLIIRGLSDVQQRMKH